MAIPLHAKDYHRSTYHQSWCSQNQSICDRSIHKIPFQKLLPRISPVPVACIHFLETEMGGLHESQWGI